MSEGGGPEVRRLPRGLPDDVRETLVEEAQDLVFTPPHPRAGGWCATVDPRGRRGVREAVRLLRAAAAHHGLDVAPNEASFQRYEPGGNGLPRTATSATTSTASRS